MTSLREAQWTTDGEILNLDRHILLSNMLGKEADSIKYLHRKAAPESFHRAMSFLDECTHSKGYLYKDVTQSFLLSAWPRLSEFTTIYLHRSVVDVAYSVLGRNWDWPAHVINRKNPSRADVLHGLLLAEECLKAIPARIIDFDEVIHSPQLLEKLLPEYPVTPVNFLTDDFCRQRDAILQKRRNRDYQELEEEIEILKSTHLQ